MSILSVYVNDHDTVQFEGEIECWVNAKSYRFDVPLTEWNRKVLEILIGSGRINVIPEEVIFSSYRYPIRFKIVYVDENNDYFRATVSSQPTFKWSEIMTMETVELYFEV